LTGRAFFGREPAHDTSHPDGSNSAALGTVRVDRRLPSSRTGGNDHLIDGFGDARVLASENRRLEEALATLKSQHVTLQSDLVATQQAAEGLATLPFFPGFPARCLYRDLGRGLLLVVIDPETEMNLVVDTPVLGAGGVVGRVIRTEGHSCWVENLTRATAAVAVMTLDGSTHCLAEGTGSVDLRIHYVPRQADLVVGQMLVTSGADGIYPPGFPVCDITSVREGGSAFLEISAHPRANPATLQAVWLIDETAQSKHPKSGGS